MKNVKSKILSIIFIICSIAVISIYVFSIGYSEVASYGNYVIGGLGGFLILEELLLPFSVSFLIMVISGAILIYRIVKEML